MAVCGAVSHIGSYSNIVRSGDSATDESCEHRRDGLHVKLNAQITKALRLKTQNVV